MGERKTRKYQCSETEWLKEKEVGSERERRRERGERGDREKNLKISSSNLAQPMSAMNLFLNGAINCLARNEMRVIKLVI